MIQIIASIIVAIWYFRAAKERDESGFGWAVIGLAAMYIPGLIWGFFAGLMLPELIGRVNSDAEAIILGLGIGGVGLVLGLITAVGVYNGHLKPQKEPEYDAEAAGTASKSASDSVWHCDCGEINLNMAADCRLCGAPRQKAAAAEEA